MKREKLLIGWREWCALPGLGIPAIKFKTDTGADTSSLHAMHLETFHQDGKLFARFETHPIQRNNHVTKQCVVEVAGKKHIRSSNGMSEERYIIKTPMTIGKHTWDVKLTLTSRAQMGFRMLLGREAMHDHMLIDPDKSYYFGDVTESELGDLYP